MNLDTLVGICIVVYCISGIVYFNVRLIFFLLDFDKKNKQTVNSEEVPTNSINNYEQNAYLNLQKDLNRLQSTRFSPSLNTSRFEK